MRRSLFLLCGFVLAACSSDPPKIYGPVYGDDAGKDGSLDASLDAAPTDGGGPDVKPGDAATCTQTVAVVAGNSASLAYAISVGGAAYAGTALAGSTIDRVAVIADAVGYTFVARAQGDALFASSSTGTTFPAPTAVGASARDTPALALFSGKVNLVYQASDFKYYRAVLSGASWSPSAETVGTGVGQSFGPRAPAAAALGANLVVLQGGDDTVLYDRTFDGSWQAPHAQTGTAVDKTLPPSMVALTAGSADALAVYLRNADFKIMSVTRTSGVWSAPALLDVNAFANEPIALAPMSGGRAVLAYRGSDLKAYFSVYDGSKWSLPAPLGVSIESTPAVAPGVCGADAMIAWAKTGGGVEVARLESGAVSASASVTGTAGAKWVGIAAR